jgi:hypothetical protein
MVQPPSVSYTSLIISFFKDWNTVIGSGSLVGVITVSLSVYTIRRQKKVGDKTKNLRGQYIDKLKAYNSKKLDKAQRQAIERIMEEIMTDKELQKDEVERLTSYANHLLRKK